MKNNFNQIKYKQAFTLVETLVAVSIFTLSILGLMAVLSQGISNTNYAKKKIIATYLAQEGVEYIRNMRDTYVLYDASGGQSGWSNFNTKLNSGGCRGAGGCYFNDVNVNYTVQNSPITNLNFSPCGGASPTCSNGALLYDSTTGKYGSSGALSGFTRKIAANVVTANETKILSTVYWTQGSGSYQITFSESLFNWVE